MAEDYFRRGGEAWGGALVIKCSLNPDPNFSSCDKDEEEFESWLDNLEQGLQYIIKDSTVYKNPRQITKLM